MSMNTQNYQRKAQRAEPRRRRHTGSGSEAVMMPECVVIVKARRSRKKRYDGQNLVFWGVSFSTCFRLRRKCQWVSEYISTD